MAQSFVRRLVLKFMLACAVLWAALVCALSSQRLTEAARPALEAALSRALQREIRLGRLTVVALPPRLIVDQVQLGPGPPGAARVDGQVTIEQVRITPGLWPLLWARTLTLKELEVVRPSAELTLKNEGPQHAPTPTRLQLPIDVRTLHIEDGQAVLLGPSGRAQVVGVQLDVNPTGFSGRSVALEVAQISVHGFFLPPLSPAWEGELHGAAALSGSLAEPSGLLIDALEASGKGVVATLSGEVNLRPHVPLLRLGCELKAALAPQAAVWPQLKGWQGELLTQLRLVGPLPGPRLSAEVVLESLIAPHGQDLGQVRGRLVVSPKSVNIERLAWRPAGTQRQAALVGSGQLELRAPWRARAAVRLDELPSDAIWALGRNPDGPVQLTCSGPVRLQGSLGHGLEPAQTKLDLRCHDVSLFGRRTPAGRSLQLHWPTLGVRGTVSMASHQLSTQALTLQSPGGPIDVSGRVSFGGQTPPSVQLHATAKALHLAALGPIAHLDYGGVGHLEAAISGLWPQVHVVMPFEAQALSIGPIGVGEGRGTLGFADGELAVTDVVVTRPSGTVDGAIRIALHPTAPTVKAHMAVHGVEASELSFALGVPPAAAKLLHARLWGSVHAQGPLRAPMGMGLLKTPMLAMGEVTLGPSELSLQFADAQRWVGGALRVRLPIGTLGAQASLSKSRVLLLTVAGERLPLALVPALGRAEVAGALDIALRLEGPLRKLRGEAQLRVPALALASQPTGASELSAQLDGTQLSLRLQAADGALMAQGSGALVAPHPMQLRAQLNQLHCGSLFALPGMMAPGALRELGLVLSGKGELRGPLNRPEQLQASAHFDHMEGSWRGLVLRLQKAASLQVAHGRLRLHGPMRLVGPGLTASLHGALPLTNSPRAGNLALSLAADGDLSLVQAFVKDIDAAHGPVRVRGTMGGAWAKPSLLGEMEVRHGSMRWHKSEHVLEQVALKAIFSGQAVAITQGSARLGRGTIRLSGEAAPKNGRLSELGHDLSLRLALHHVPLEPASDVQALVSGNLELTGGGTGPALAGQLRIESLRYTARIDLDRLVPKRAAPPLRTPLLQGLPPLKLHVQLIAPNNLIVLSSVLESELACDLTLTGTTARMGMLGSVTPLWARARWRNNTFVLTRASIDFVDEFRIAPQFSVRAHTEACHMQAEVLVEGSVDGYNVVPSGRDERGVVDPQDVLACLQLGLRLRDFDGNGRGGATMDAALSGLDTLWTVSGLNDKVRKMLPIGVDELRLTSGWSSLGQRTTARVLVGKDLGKHVALRYSRSLDEYNDQAFSLDYRLAERATMQGNWVSTRDVPVGDLGVDLRLHWEVL